jgi:hypothetical protein
VLSAPRTSSDLKELIAYRRRELAGLRHALMTYFDYAISGWQSWIVDQAAIFALENVCYWHLSDMPNAPADIANSPRRVGL